MDQQLFTHRCVDPMTILAAVPPVHEVVVADRLRLPDGSVVVVPAAPLLEGSLRRLGIRPRRETIELRRGVRADGSGMLVGWWNDATGSAEGMVAHVTLDVFPVVSASVREWWEVRGDREIVLANPRSFCAGVERAIEIVDRLLAAHHAPVFVRKEIVHNSTVVADLRDRGAVFVDDLDAVPDGAAVVFSAHGVSAAVRREAGSRGLEVVDATCPLVAKVHHEARRFARRGDTVLLIGHAGHEETEGTLGEAPAQTILVQDVEDAHHVEVPDPRSVSYLTQTTLAVDETAEILAVLRRRFPALRGPKSEDICYATTNRQRALREVAGQSDVVLVIGSANSSNSQRLVELAQRHGTPAHLVDSVADIRPEWLRGRAALGLTAGASAPPALVDGVVDALAGLGAVAVRECTSATEAVRFTLPADLGRS